MMRTKSCHQSVEKPAQIYDLHQVVSPVKLEYLTRYIHGRDLLDVGSGPGYYSAWISHQYAAMHVVATDHLESVAGPFEYRRTDLEQKLPFSDGSFDVMVAFDVIEHIAHVEQLMRELYRVARPGAVLIGSVPHDEDRFLPAYNLTFYHRSDVTHKRYYTKETLTAELERVGFVVELIEKKGGVNPQVVSEFFIPALRWPVQKMMGLLRRIGMVRTDVLYSDLFFVAYKR